VKLLFDQNLPRRLVREFEADFPGSAHVRDLRLDTATDPAIFTYAGEHGFTIISKDNDFAQLSFLRGIPPKVVWLRVGNRSTRELKEFFHRNTEHIQNFESASESFLVLEPSDG
jgi:predicted nuclease of predicted toxin-antitoxin system